MGGPFMPWLTSLGGDRLCVRRGTVYVWKKGDIHRRASWLELSPHMAR